MTTMTSDRRSSSRGVRLLAVPLLAAALALPTVLPAQQRPGEEARSTREGDSLRRQRAQLLERLDSLRREFDEEPLTAAERQQLSNELTSLIMSLAEISRIQVEMPHMTMEAERAAKSAARAAMTFQGSMWREAMPRGWIGINVDAPQVHEVRGQEQFVRYFDYPQILSVEPNSPAERAGIAAGDVLIAYNGTDVRSGAINVTRLLRPNERVRVTVDRDGDRRVITVRVAKAPEQFQLRRMMLAPAPSMPPYLGKAPTVAPDAPVLAGVPTPPPTPAAPSAGAMPSMPSMPSMSDDEDMGRSIRLLGRGSGWGQGMIAFGGGFASDDAPVAGAQLVQARDRDLARYFGVSHGLIVTNLVPGPARTSGLRGGDVIVRAGGRNVTNTAEFRQIVAAHTPDRSVELVIVRDRREQRLTLHW